MMNSLDSNYDVWATAYPTLNTQTNIEDLTTQTNNFELSLERIIQLDRAIAEARANQSKAAEAVAHECAARFYGEWGKAKIAAVYLRDAYDCYASAGANAECDRLVRSYPQLLQSMSQERQQIERTNYFNDEFVATLSHEFRTPLNGLLGMTEALLEEVFGAMNESQLNAVTTIDRSGGYLLALINNMTDLSKLQVGKLALEIVNVSVAELCYFSTTFVKHQAIQKQIQLDTDICASAGNITIDLQRMRQVLINLLTHAIDSTQPGGCVKLVVTRHQSGEIVDATSSIELAIVDTRKQMSVSSSDEKSPSVVVNNRPNGLGLMLVKPIVELHGGSLSSRTIGRENCVVVSLPHTCLLQDRHIEREDLISSPSERTIDRVPEPPLILIVEDNELNINTIASYLTAKGYRPIVATDGQSAIDMSQLHHPALILMDIQMPGMDGIEAISHIRQNPQIAMIPIIALTALAMESDRDRCLAAGANEYLPKPVKLKQLHATIQQFLISNTADISTALSDFWL
jgi:CheY-like chemotaxis protein